MPFFSAFLPRRKAAKPPRGNASPWFELPLTFAARRWTSGDYRSAVEAGYRDNAIAHRCVREIAGSVASAPVLLYDAAGREYTSHPALSLLRQPNPSTSGMALMEAIATQLLLSGNAYLEAIVDDAGWPRELWLLRADRMQVIPGDHSVAGGYRYTLGQTRKEWDTDPLTGFGRIVHLRLPNPLDDWYGLAPLEVAMAAIDQFNAAETWNQALLQNGCRPSGALVVESGKDSPSTLTEEQYTRLKSELEQNYTAATNAGRPMLLEGGLRWVDMMISPKDMDFLEMRHAAARAIAVAFGYPPMLLGIPGDNTYSNQKDARLALWEQTILPLIDTILGGLSTWLSGHYGEVLSLRPDTDAISALLPRREMLWQRINEATFLTDAEKREALGYGTAKGRKNAVRR